MGWPLSQEYNEAVQNPRTAFSDPDLKGGEVIPGPLGIPMPRSGNFADVYQARDAAGKMWAIKLFTRPAAGLRERYLKIDAHLRTAQLPFSVGFEFQPEGIRIRGLQYPVLKMEWVEGFTLNEFVRANVDKPKLLGALLGMWVKMCKRLRDSNMAHADLQHGNVLLVPGANESKLRLRLIDYDGMWVPALAKKPSGEAGHPAYQHPLRLQKAEYSEHVDRFPHLVIACALRALAVAGKPLWDKYDNGDNLLFREVDLGNPAASPLYRDLWKLNDPTVTYLVTRLLISTGWPIDETFWLDEVMEEGRPIPVTVEELNYAADVLGVPRRAPKPVAIAAPVYTVPTEANVFASFGDESPGLMRRPQKRPRTLMHMVVGLGGFAIVAASVVIAMLAMNREKINDEGPPPIAPGAGSGGEKVKVGLIDTRWEAVVPGKAFEPSVHLVSGLDTAPPRADVIRAFPIGKSASLGVWLMPDGQHALAASKTGLMSIDLHTKGSLKIGQFTIEPMRVAISSDGKLAAMYLLLDKDHAVVCMNLETGERLWDAKFEGPVGALAFTADNRRVAATTERIGYREYAAADGKVLRSHEQLQASQLFFTPDGLQAIALNNGIIERWSLDEGTTKPIDPNFAATQIALSPDGKRLYATGSGSTVRVWVAPEFTPIDPHEAKVKAQITALSASKGGELLVGSQAGEVEFIAADNTAFSLPLVRSPGGRISAFAMTSDADYAMVASEANGCVLTRLNDLVRSTGPSRTGPMAGCLELTRSIESPLAYTHFASDGKGERFLAVSSTKSKARKNASQVDVYDAEKFTIRVKDGLPRFEGKILAAGFGPGSFLVTCEETDDGPLTRSRNVNDAELFPGPTFKINGRAIGEVSRIAAVAHPLKPWVVVTIEERGDVLFDVNTGEPVVGWPESSEENPLTAIVSGDGQRIAIASQREKIRIWESETASVARRCESSEGVKSLAFLPGTTFLAGIWPEGRIRVWDVSSGAIVKDIDHDYSGPFAEIAGIASNIVLIGPAPNQFLLNIETGKALNTGNGPDPLLGKPSFTPSNGWIVAGDEDKRLNAWRVNAKLAEKLPGKKPSLSKWRDAAIVRDAPRSDCVGLSFATNGTSVLAASANGKITRYSADRLLHMEEIDLRPPRPKKGKEAGFQLKSMLQGSETLALLSDPFKLTTLQAPNFEPGETIPASGAVGSAQPVFAIHPSGDLVFLSTSQIRAWHLQGDRKTMRAEFRPTAIAAIPAAAKQMPLTQFTWSADGTTGLARWGDRITALWHPKRIGPAIVLEELAAPSAAAQTAVALSADGKFGVIGLAAGPITVWNLATKKAITNDDEYLPNRDGPSITAIVPLPNNRQFLSVGRSGRVVLWDFATLKKLKDYKCPEGPWRMAVSPDGRTAILHQAGLILRIDLPAEG